MRYPIEIDGFDGRDIFVETQGLFSGPRLFIDGHQATKGPKPKEFVLVRNDGAEVTGKFRFMFLDPLPPLTIAGQRVKVTEPLKWHEWAWIGWPIILVFAGGAVGGGLGASAAYVNARVFRSGAGFLTRYAATGMISLTAFVICVIISTIVLELAY